LQSLLQFEFCSTNFFCRDIEGTQNELVVNQLVGFIGGKFFLYFDGRFYVINCPGIVTMSVGIGCKMPVSPKNNGVMGIYFFSQRHNVKQAFFGILLGREIHI